MSNLTLSSLSVRINRYYTRLTSTKAGTAALALFALYAVRKYFQRRRSIAARKAWSNPTREVAVITGGSGGIGIQVAKCLAAKGVHIAILDIAEPKAAILSNTVRFYKTDITDYDNILEASKAIEKDLGTVSILINNAGVANPGPSVFEFDPKNTKLTIEVNLLSHFYTLSIFGPIFLKAGRGHILSVASAGSFLMPAGGADYGATKAGLLALHETLQIELDVLYQRKGILCSIAHPFWCRSPLTERIFTHEFHQKMIDPALVGQKIADQVLGGQGGSIYVPGWIGNMPWIRVLPHSLQHKIRVNATLDLQRSRREDRAGALLS